MTSVGFLLVAAAAGYWVLERADKHRGQLRQFGRFLGGLIIVVSLIGTACRVWSVATGSGYSYHQGTGKKGFCPFSGKTAQSQPPPAAME